MEEVNKETVVIEEGTETIVNEEEVTEEVEKVPTVEELAEKLKQLEDVISEKDKLINDKDETLKSLEEQAKIAEQLSFNMVLRNEGLEGFAELFTTNDRTKQVEILKNAINDVLIEKSYVPKDNQRQDEYTTHIKKGNVEGAIKSKFAQFFG